MKRTTVFIVAALVTFSAVSASHAILGAGFHWGFDYSLSMKDVEGERVDIPLPPEVADDLAGIDFFRVSRTGWKASPINLGGKAYIDLIPFIEAIELSFNFGLWQYDGSLQYLDVIPSLESIAGGGAPKYSEPIKLTLENQGLKFSGLERTPYAKLQFDATVRKTLLDLWIVKLSGGAGASAHFATPLLTSKLIESAIGNVKVTDPAALFDPNGGANMGKAIVQEIINDAFGKPVIGMHILLGVKAKLPVMPIGIYVDGKFMIPFTSYDEDVANKDNGVKGYGLLVNAGLSLSI